MVDSGLLGSMPFTTPSDPFIKLHNHDIKSFEYIPSYKRIIGRLLYLNMTLISWLSSLVNFHLNRLLSIIMQHLGFLDTLKVVQVVVSSSQGNLLFTFGFSYVDSVECIKTIRSVSGSCFFIGSSLISWKTEKKNIISRSYSEGEYQALADAYGELQRITYLLHDLQVTC